MPLSWSEIKNRAITFVKEWENDGKEKKKKKERALSQTFWIEFFHIFGISQRRVSSFEEPVKKLGGGQGFVDLLWKGVILIEHKSSGADLDKAFAQAKDYFPGLKEHELPKYILVCDFERFRLYNLDENVCNEFELKELLKNISLFGFIAGYEKRIYKEQDAVNIDAAEKMGRLHDALEAIGYRGHNLEVYLVRLLFCLFAEDTGIFERTQFQDYIDKHTKEDGSDLGMHLGFLFEVLNQPKKKRFTILDETINAFPYVNGKLFEELLPTAAFNTEMRNLLLSACSLDWSKISPAIFGSMFQAAMNPNERRNLGAHYTSEQNIQKVIKPLFLDNLYTEFEKAKGSTARLNAFHQKLSRLYFLDPACGCGNFLIIAYRELRLLEISILKELNKTGQGFLDVSELIKVEVNQFAGIEYDEFAARIAQVAMWLIDHQMNMEVSLAFGQYYARLPLQNAAVIVHGNALREDWYELERKVVEENKKIIFPNSKVDNNKNLHTSTSKGKVKTKVKNKDFFDISSPEKEETQIIPPFVRGENNSFTYLLGNPPFIGKQLQTAVQKEDMTRVFQGVQGAGELDYVAAWYLKAAQFIQNMKIKVAFVSTNSIAQGEQVGILWNELFNKYKIKIHFAHQTFSWSNEARGNAAVHCVIIGFANYDSEEKYLFEYDDIKGDANGRMVKNINPYLAEGDNILLQRRLKPLCNVSHILKGSQPTDGGNLLLEDDEKIAFLKEEPLAEKWIKPFIGSEKFLQGEKKWCLWLVNITPNELIKMPTVIKRVQAVKDMRLQSTKLPTIKWATRPTIFTENRQPDSDYLLIPRHSSETRRYIPIAFFSKDYIVGDSCSFIPNASLFLFGQLTSLMHMVWVKYVCGRIRNDFRYSNTIVYNNYPFPQTPTKAQYKKVEDAAKKVLDIRANYPETSLTLLYDSLTMPSDLAKAHAALDKAVDLCYRPQPFTTELSRIEFLFALYEEYTSPMFQEEKKKKGENKKTEEVVNNAEKGDLGEEITED